MKGPFWRDDCQVAGVSAVSGVDRPLALVDWSGAVPCAEWQPSAAPVVKTCCLSGASGAKHRLVVLDSACVADMLMQPGSSLCPGLP